MMFELLKVGREIRNSLSEFLDGFYGLSSLIRGVALDFDDYWDTSLIGDRYFWNGSYYADPLQSLRKERQFHLTYNELDTKIMSYRPQKWDEHCKLMSYPTDGNPIIIKVYINYHHYHAFSSLSEREIPRSFKNYPIVYEFRKPNKAMANFFNLNAISDLLNFKLKRKAISIKAQNSIETGTLGGLLFDTSSRSPYIVTCAHVVGDVGSNARYRRLKWMNRYEHLGSVNYRKIPDTIVSDEICNGRANPRACKVDVALIKCEVPLNELAENGIVTKVNSIRSISSMSRNDIVSFNGKTSGRIEARLGAVTLWDTVFFGNERRCFGELFEIKPLERQYIVEELAKPGDSGSWVISELDTLVEWNGMIVSADGSQAYACYAENILETLSSEGKLPSPMVF